MAESVNPRVAAYAADIAEALKPLVARDCGFGEYYISRVTLAFEGEGVGVSLVPDEFGGLAIKIEGSGG
jgi:hypothetical protein